MKTPRRRDSGVSLGRFISFKNPPLPPFPKVGLAETPQQRLWGIENLNKDVLFERYSSEADQSIWDEVFIVSRIMCARLL